MTTTNREDDLVITFEPEATEEEKERFLTELARVVLVIARHLVTLEEEGQRENGLETIDF